MGCHFRKRSERIQKYGQRRHAVLSVEALEGRLLPAVGPHFLKDLQPGTSSSRIEELTDVGGTLFFSAGKPEVSTGRDATTPSQSLVRTDGTAAGTAVLHRFSETSWPGVPTPAGLRERGGTLYFTGEDNTGTALWRSDGTPGGTVALQQPGSGTDFAALGGTLLYVTAGKLWRSDGTAAGTSAIATVGLSTVFLEPLGTFLVFAGKTSTGTLELWKSDGTAAGTVRLRDFGPSGNGSISYHAAAVGGTLYFVAHDAAHGTELWKTDGTPGGTVLVKDLAPGAADSRFDELTPGGAALYFVTSSDAAGRGIGRTDGTEAGTTVARDAVFSSVALQRLTVVGPTLYFTTGATAGNCRLWRSDGTDAGTSQLRTFGMGADEITALAAFGGDLYFLVSGSIDHGLWRSDGTDAATARVKDVAVGRSETFESARLLVPSGASLFFAADDAAFGRELWKSDGTEAGTTLVVDFTTDPRGSFPAGFTRGSAPAFLTGPGVWETDGTAAGTVPLPAAAGYAGGPTGQPIVIQAGVAYSPHLTRVGNSVYFTGQPDAASWGLWRSDGTVPGTVLVRQVQDGTDHNPFLNLVPVGNTLYFRYRTELWRTDGTPSGTTLVRDVGGQVPEDGEGSPVAAGDLLLFGQGNTLWRSDGTAEGTVSLHTFAAGSFVRDLLDVPQPSGPVAYFWNDEITRVALWRTDGTAAGTVPVRLPLGGAPENVSRLVLGPAGVYFLAASPGGPLTDTLQLWRTDGTPGGTVQVVTVPHTNYYAAQITVASGTIFFAAGGNLWASDGTPGGTRRLAAFQLPAFVGATESVEFTTVVGRLFFRAGRDAQSSAATLWTSDGTPAGTHPVTDPAGHAPDAVGRALGSTGQTVLFSASDVDHGEELWGLDATEVPVVVPSGLGVGLGGTPNQRYVGQLYRDLLHREADATGLSHWAGLLAHGAHRDDVFGRISHSEEHIRLVIDDLYHRLLQRGPDAGAFAFFLPLFGRGLAVEQAQEVLLASDEYFRLAGGTAGGFLAAVYRDVLGRNVDASGAATFQGLAGTATGRAAVARTLLRSGEAREAFVRNSYRDFLRRGQDPAGLAFFAHALAAGATREQVWAGLTSAPEYAST